MIVRQFLHWLRTAPSGERAEATSALARAFLYSNLSENDRAAAEGAMIMLLDDPSPLVRGALANVFAASSAAPPTVVHALAADQPDVAAPVLRHSPLLLDADLVEAVATGESARQIAVARRRRLPRSVAAAIAEVGTPEACLVLLESSDAEIVPFSLDRIVQRCGHLAAIRDVLLTRHEISAPTRQALVAKLSDALAEFVTSREWLAEDRARRVTREACEKATIALAACSDDEEVRPLIRHLRESGQLTAGLMLRSLLSGHVEMFEEALSELARVPLSRVIGIVHDRRGAGFRALYDKAGLPAASFSAFRAALEAMREEGSVMNPGAASRLKRRIVERVLTSVESEAPEDIEPLLTLLRRYAAEAAREEARLFCEELVADSLLPPEQEFHQVAA